MTKQKHFILLALFGNKKTTARQWHSFSDEELVQSIVKDYESQLFGIIYDRYSKKVYNKCYSFVKDMDEAKDLVQDVFLRAYLKLESYSSEKAAFSTWLYVITYNLCTNYVTRNKKTYSRDELKLGKKLHSDLMDEEVDIEEINELSPDKFEIAMDRIPPSDKALLLLKYQDDAPVKELETLLGVGESAVKMRLNRAKLKVVKTYHSL